MNKEKFFCAYCDDEIIGKENVTEYKGEIMCNNCRYEVNF